MAEGVIEITDATFDQQVLKSGHPVLVDFWATWCGPCRALAPVLTEVAAEFNGRVTVAKMDVDHNPATPGRYGVRGIPAVFLFKDGKVVEQLVGFRPKEEFVMALNRHVPSAVPVSA